jgi:hypothetical protein
MFTCLMYLVISWNFHRFLIVITYEHRIGSCRGGSGDDVGWGRLRRPWWDIARGNTYAAHDGELLFGVMRLGRMTLVAQPLRKPAHEGALT